MYSIEGDGMVTLAVLRVMLLRYANASTMMGLEQPILPVTVAIGGCSDVPPKRF